VLSGGSNESGLDSRLTVMIDPKRDSGHVSDMKRILITALLVSVAPATVWAQSAAVEAFIDHPGPGTLNAARLSLGLPAPPFHSVFDDGSAPRGGTTACRTLIDMETWEVKPSPDVHRMWVESCKMETESGLFKGTPWEVTPIMISSNPDKWKIPLSKARSGSQ